VRIFGRKRDQPDCRRSELLAQQPMIGKKKKTGDIRAISRVLLLLLLPLL
jgi:hypothetical protein